MKFVYKCICIINTCVNRIGPRVGVAVDAVPRVASGALPRVRAVPPAAQRPR